MDAASQPALDDATVIERTREATAAELSGETVILDPGSGKYFGLKDVGSRVWELLERPQAFGRLRDVILEEYEIDDERCTRDLVALVRQLENVGLVVVRHAPPK